MQTVHHASIVSIGTRCDESSGDGSRKYITINGRIDIQENNPGVEGYQATACGQIRINGMRFKTILNHLPLVVEPFFVRVKEMRESTLCFCGDDTSDHDQLQGFDRMEGVKEQKDSERRKVGFILIVG